MHVSICVRRPCLATVLVVLTITALLSVPGFVSRPSPEDLAPPPVEGRRPAPRRRRGDTDVKAPERKRSNTGQVVRPHRDKASYERQRTFFQLAAAWSKTKPFPLPDTNGCGFALRDVCFGEDSQYLTAATCAAPEYRRPGAALALCPIDVNSPTDFVMPLSVDIPILRKQPLPEPSEHVPYAVFVQLFRPQHAMQSFFSLASAFAFLWHVGAVGDNGAEPWVPVLYSIAQYGGVHGDADLRDRRRLHLELIFKTLGPAARMVDLSHTGLSFVQPHLAGVEFKKACYKSVAFGTLPQRIPSALNLRTASLPSSTINTTHFLALRQRIVTAFGVWEAPQDRYVLMVVRKSAGRQVLNTAELERAVIESTGGRLRIERISWEDMPIEKQLSLAVHASGMVGVHGNGLAWQCLMRPGSFVIELASRVPDKNEVTPGVDVLNAGNIAAICGMRSLSLRCAYESNAAAKAAPHQAWKEVDLVVGTQEVAAIRSFLLEWGKKRRA